VTRRQFVNYAGLSTVGSMSCRAERTHMEKELHEWEERNDVAVLNISLTALKINGDRIGSLVLPNCCTAEPSVAPDGACVAWIPSTQSLRPSSSEDSIVRVIDVVRPARTMRYSGHLARVLTISTDATKAAVLALSNGRGSGSVLVFGADGEADFTRLLSGMDPAEIERLRLSGDGELLAVGSRTSAVVIDLKAGKTIFQSRGRFPTLSPDGKSLAYIDEQAHLVCQDLRNNTAKLLRLGSNICGVGGWSADNRYILAGTRMPMSVWNRLIVVDAVGSESVDSFKLGEGDYGNRCVWISRRLVSA
jgi:hypothetical protein